MSVDESVGEFDVAARLAAVRARLAAAARAAGRPADGVSLIAVSKKQPLARVAAALAAGHRVFGENRVQEAAGKWPALKARYPDVELHLIGPLQTNKVRDALALFDVIHTVDRARLARRLAAGIARAGRRPVCLVEVNIGREPQKAGLPPGEVDAFTAACRAEYGLTVSGLMCIPPVGAPSAPHFTRLAALARRLELPLLSMGMSADYEIAVRLGATHVRVGTAIFGPRPETAPVR